MMVLYNHQRKGNQKGERVKDMSKEYYEIESKINGGEYNSSYEVFVDVFNNINDYDESVKLFFFYYGR